MINFLATNGVSNLSLDIVFTVLMVFFIIAVVVVAVWLYTKYIKKPRYKETFEEKVKAYDSLPEEKKGERPVPLSFLGICFAVMGVGLIIRLLFMFLVRGYRSEFYSITNGIILNSSPSSLYTSHAIAHYPVITYIYSFFGLFARAFNLDASSEAMNVFVKLPLILADMGLIFVGYKIAKKYVNEYVAVITAGFIAVFPPFIIVSSVWGSVFAITVLLLVLSFYFLANRNLLGLFISYTLALLTSRAALYLFPIIATVVIYQFARSFLFVRRNTIEGGIKGIFKNPESRNVFLIPIYIVGFWIASWLITLPLIHNHSFNPFVFTFMIYLYPLSQFSYFGYNALNIFNLFVGISGNGAPWTASAGISILFSVIFGVIITGLVALVYLSRKNRALVVFLAGYVYFTLSIFFIGFGATNLIIVIALFLLAFLLIRDKRILQLVAVLGIIFTLNISFIFISAGYLNNIGQDVFNSGIYTGETLLGGSTDAMGWLVANLILSIFAMFTFIYATIIILDIAMSSRRKLLADLDRPNALTAFAKFIRE